MRADRAAAIHAPAAASMAFGVIGNHLRLEALYHIPGLLPPSWQRGRAGARRGAAAAGVRMGPREPPAPRCLPPHPRPPRPGNEATRVRADRAVQFMPCGSSDGLRRSREPPAPRSRTTTSQASFPCPGKVGVRMHADRAVQFMPRRQQQASAWGPGNHLRLEAAAHHVLPRSEGGTCSPGRGGTGGAWPRSSGTKMMIFRRKAKALAALPCTPPVAGVGDGSPLTDGILARRCSRERRARPPGRRTDPLGSTLSRTQQPTLKRTSDRLVPDLRTTTRPSVHPPAYRSPLPRPRPRVRPRRAPPRCR